MKHLFALILGLLLLAPISAQELPPPKEIDGDYRKEYRREFREEKREQKQLQQDEWDIIIPPIEKVPVQTYDQLPPANADNWGVRLLLPDALKQRIATECAFPVVLKITDTGVDVDHPDLIGPWRMTGTNYTTSSSVDDVQGHGTHVAGIATAQNFGIAYELARAGKLRLKSVKILSDQGSGSFSWVANAYRTERTEDQQIIQQGGAVVYNGSFGGGTSAIRDVEEELQKSTEAGVVFVFAAGNTNGPVNYPGLSRYAITVSSLDQNLKKSSFSSFGPEVSQAKPGRSITSTYPGGRYASLSGTSMASPFSAGIVCLALSRWGRAKLPDYNAVRDYLEEIAYDLGDEGHDDLYGHGLVYVSAVLDNDPDDILDGGTPPPPPPPPPPAPGKDVTVATTFDEPVILRYRTQAEHERGTTGLVGWRVIIITSMTCQVAEKESPITLYDEVDRLFQEYWYGLGKAMVIPNEDTAAEAIDYAARFFYYWTRDKTPVYVKELTGYDEQGRKFEIRRTEEQYGGVPASLNARMIYY